MPLTASTLTDSLPALPALPPLPALPSAASLSASSRAALKDLSLPKIELDRRQRRRLKRNRRELEHAIDRNRELLGEGARRLRRSSRRLAAHRPWQKPTFTEQLIDVTAQIVAPRPEDPSPLTVVLDTVGPVTDSVRETVAEQVAQVSEVGRSGWQLLHPRSEDSHASLWSSHSSYSALSTHSLASFGSALSILSAGSILSLGSTGSILSIGSVGSVLSIGSVGSVLSIGAAGRNGLAPSADLGPGAATPNAALLGTTTRIVQVSAGLLGACAIVAAAVRD
jgi:hypothetical protein